MASVKICSLTIAYYTDEMIFSFAFKHILDFISASDLLKIQSLSRYMYEVFIPRYFASTKERGNILQKLSIINK
jgi:hypothetical protein